LPGKERIVPSYEREKEKVGCLPKKKSATSVPKWAWGQGALVPEKKFCSITAVGGEKVRLRVSLAGGGEKKGGQVWRVSFLRRTVKGKGPFLSFSLEKKGGKSCAA